MDSPVLASKIEPLEIKHRDQLTLSLGPIGRGLSEYSFSSLYLFRNVHQYQVIHDRYTFIQGKTYDGWSHLMPAFDLSGVSNEYLVETVRGSDCFFPIHQDDLRYFDQDRFCFETNRDDADYIFSADKLKTYKGRNLSPKRNLTKQFAARHFHQFRELDKRNTHHAFEILDDWLEDVGKSIDETDYHPCREALSNLEALDLFGFIYYSKVEPCGFVIGKEIYPQICVFHFAKGKRKFKGVFQFMFNHIANQFSKRFQFYNFEQDMGKTNFRKTKQSYFPDRLLDKYRVRLKS